MTQTLKVAEETVTKKELNLVALRLMHTYKKKKAAGTLSKNDEQWYKTRIEKAKKQHNAKS